MGMATTRTPGGVGQQVTAIPVTAITRLLSVGIGCMASTVAARGPQVGDDARSGPPPPGQAGG